MVVEERRWRRPSTSAVRRTLSARYGEILVKELDVYGSQEEINNNNNNRAVMLIYKDAVVQITFHYYYLYNCGASVNFEQLKYLRVLQWFFIINQEVA